MILFLTPFCGTSVTGYESVRLGRKYIGIDNNPIAILISKAKLLFPETESLRSIFDEFFKGHFINIKQNTSHPNEEILLRWYHHDTYLELNQILSIIRNISNPIMRIPAQAVFSSILKRASSQGKHWGWVCDNVVPKPNEIMYKNAIEIFNKSLKAYCTYVEETLTESRKDKVNTEEKRFDGCGM